MARLHGSLKLEEVVDAEGQTVLREGRTVWRLLDPLEWRIDAPDGLKAIVVPKLFETDLASVPALFRGLIPSSGPWQRAAVIHDYLYSRQGKVGIDICDPTRTIINYVECHFSRRECDDIFNDAMKAAQVKATTRFAIFCAVRVGGGKGWGR